ncbi:PfkB family carbohydrate kinase [Cryobacterium sp. BB736]|uniref:PfkB family carbohydrate kinase n=1 Tax=Cryobacterium sp. BB736 TaxID=2746963 RepID=UPI001875D3AD|nr:PfkB family carbohydrate kinase [Cryobacterium sp. BB736]
MTAKLVCVGDVVIDIAAKLDELPAAGGDVLTESGGLFVGGAGYNVMVAASRQGLPAVYGGAHGTGPFGDLARAALREAGIAVAADPIPDADTGWDVALTDASGERTFITTVGAEARLSREQLDALAVEPGDFVFVSGYGLLQEPGRSAITGWLSTLPSGVTVVTDPGPLVLDIPADTLAAVQDATTWWSCNLTEALADTGAASAEAAARLIADTGCGAVVRTGADGCVVAEPGGEPRAVPGFAVAAVDTNGAGDAHVGAFAAALASGLPPLDAARRANASAAIAVTRIGPATGPTLDEVDAFLASHGSAMR